ncbi:MAG: glycosyltransferase family 39 protein, partial [Candidatus Omnitrophica bacterium]|nr:glycosyltransferase family 39 protein [Candidatus Omnitrophota bacterium]
MLHPKLITKFLTAIALFLMAFLTYFNCFNHAFLLDDWTLIVPASFDPYFLQILGTHTTAVYYRPLLHVLCAVNHELFGNIVSGYHLVNLIIFYLTGLSFYVLINRLFHRSLLALLAALLFLCHPINGVLVNYKIATGYVFMILASNLSLLAILRDRSKRSPSIVSAGWFLIALLCHETMAVFPLYLISMLMISRQNSLRQAVTATAPHLVFLFLYLYQRALFTSGSAGLINTVNSTGLSLFDVTALWSQLIQWYLSQLLVPTQIVLVKDAYLDPTQTVFNNLLFVLIAVGTIGLWKFSKNNSAARLGLSWFAISFVPVTIASLCRPEMGAILQPHWVTFGSLGFFLGLAGVFESVEKYIWKPLWIALLSIIFSGYILNSFVHNQNWQDQKTYCRHWLKSSPQNFWANFSLGQCYLNEGNYSLAKIHFLKSVINGTAGSVVWQNLG